MRWPIITVATTAAAGPERPQPHRLAVHRHGEQNNHERLQQHELPDARHADHRHSGIEDKEREELADEAYIGEPGPGRRRHGRQIARPERERRQRRQWQECGDLPRHHLPARHLNAQTTRQRISECARQHGDEQIDVADRKGARLTLGQNEGNDNCRTGKACEPEARARAFARNDGCRARGCERHDAEHHTAMRGGHAYHRKRGEHRKADDGAEAAKHYRAPLDAWRQRPAQHQQQDGTGTAGKRCPRRRKKQRIDGGDRKPGCRQCAAEQADAGKAKRQPEFLAMCEHIPANRGEPEFP